METKSTNIFLILFVIFLILKLTGTITWSWWIVTLPLWICPAIVLTILGICLSVVIVGSILFSIIYLIYYIIDKIRD